MMVAPLSPPLVTAPLRNELRNKEILEEISQKSRALLVTDTALEWKTMMKKSQKQKNTLHSHRRIDEIRLPGNPCCHGCLKKK